MRALILAVLFLPTTIAHASSDDAWAAFRTNVKEACRALVPQAENVTVEVNPFGSEHYGVAIVTVDSDAGTDRMICIYDKADLKAELSTPFTQ